MNRYRAEDYLHIGWQIAPKLPTLMSGTDVGLALGVTRQRADYLTYVALGKLVCGLLESIGERREGVKKPHGGDVCGT